MRRNTAKPLQGRKKGKRKKQKALSFLHKGIINTNSFTLELVIN